MILLDTHAVLWWQAGGALLSAAASRAISATDLVLISPVSCWEIGVLLEKGRIGLDRDVVVWTSSLFGDERVAQAHLSPQAAVTAALLGRDGFHGDPADRFLYATAKELIVPLVTKDDRIRAFASRTREVRTIW